MGKISDTLLILWGQEPRGYKRNVEEGAESPQEKPVAEMSHEERVVLTQKVQGDCLECRLVGGGLFLTAGTYFLYQCVTKLPKGYERKPFLYKGYNLVLGVVMLSLAGCRLLQVGPFSSQLITDMMERHEEKDIKR